MRKWVLMAMELSNSITSKRRKKNFCKVLLPSQCLWKNYSGIEATFSAYPPCTTSFYLCNSISTSRRPLDYTHPTFLPPYSCKILRRKCPISEWFLCHDLVDAAETKHIYHMSTNYIYIYTSVMLIGPISEYAFSIKAQNRQWWIDVAISVFQAFKKTNVPYNL